MKKIFLLTMGLAIWSGCASTGVDEVRITNELKYKKILVMPFTKGDGANAALARDSFVAELSLFPDIEIVGQMDETTIKNLGVTHPDSFGALDFSSTQQGEDRRKKVLESFKADAIVFGYCSFEQELVSLHIQMMDAETGEVNLSFSKDASISEGLADDATRDLARKSAQKTINFLKENVIITRFHRR